MKWADTEPLRLYVYSSPPACSASSPSGAVTDAQASHWLTLAGLVLGVVSGTESARAAVDSPATVQKKLDGGEG